MSDLGRRVFGFGALALGFVSLVTHDFATVWQPAPPETPGRTALVYAAAALQIAGGLALQWRRPAKIAGPALSALYLVFALLWGRRILGYPQIVAVWSGAGEQLTLVIAGILIWAGLPPADATSSRRRIFLASRMVFGACAIAFGFNHFQNLKETAAGVPKWLPPNRTFWALATGVAHVLAGVALLTGVRAALAARLLTAMFVVFGVLVWGRDLLAHPDDHVVWGGNAINLVLIGAAWVMADAIDAYAQSGVEPERRLGADSQPQTI